MVCVLFVWAYLLLHLNMGLNMYSSSSSSSSSSILPFISIPKKVPYDAASSLLRKVLLHLGTETVTAVVENELLPSSGSSASGMALLAAIQREMPGAGGAGGIRASKASIALSDYGPL
jgi:hypothetical protein